MRYKATFVTGALVGYVFGTKAGRERYEQIRQQFRSVKANPAVQEKADVAAHQTIDLVGTAREKVTARFGDKLPSWAGGKRDALDSGRPWTDTAGTPTSSIPETYPGMSDGGDAGSNGRVSE